MTATFIDGTKIAEDIKAEVAAEVKDLQESGIRPGFSVILVGDDAASSAYVNMKARTCEKLGINSRKLTLPGSIQTAELMERGPKAQRRRLDRRDSRPASASEARQQARRSRERGSSQGRRWFSFRKSGIAASRTRNAGRVHACRRHDAAAAIGSES